MSEVENKSEKETTMVESALNDKSKNSESAGDSLGNKASETTSPTLTSPQMDNKKTPVKRTPSKRMSFIERAQKESEELVKNMGGSLELEGGRRTRSSTRGTPTRAAPVTSPPPNKKSRSSPATANSAPARARGRGRKLNTASDEVVEKEQEPTINSKTINTNKENNVGEESTKQSEDAVDAVVEAASKKDENSVNDEGQSVRNKEEEKPEKGPEEPVAEKASEDKVEQNQSEQSVDNGLLEESSDKAESAPSQGSPMDTDEPIENVDAIEKTVSEDVVETPKETSIPEKSDEPAAAAEVPAVKEPTPEPMEVDGNSKSNDAVDNATVAAPEPVAEQAESVANDEKKTENSIEKEPLAEPVLDSKPEDTVEPKQQPLENSAADGVVEEDKANDETTVTNNNNAEVNDVAPTVEGVTNSAEKQINNDVELKSGTNAETLSSENKTENELCAPKIVSEAITTATADGALTTPQSCN